MLSSLCINYGVKTHGLVLPNGRSADDFAPRCKEPFILSAGRLWDDAKNVRALEAVAPRLGWPVCVAGSTRRPGGGEREPCHVRALGELSQDELAAHLGRAAIYALPARYEPFGQSVLEAALAGCALVLGDLPSLREVWADAAVYVPPDDHAALRDALLCLIEHDVLRERMVTRARARAAAYSPGRMADAYLAAYRSLPTTSNSMHREAACAS
jgi:glycosyltransferase involved in cell wall biosynthesis